MALAIDTIDGRGRSNEAHRQLLPKNKVTLYLLFIIHGKSTNKMQRFSFKSGRAVRVAKLTKQDWPIVLHIRISAHNNFMLLLKHFITKILEYKAGLKGRIKFVCVAMCSLVMSLCSHDLHVTSLNNNYQYIE